MEIPARKKPFRPTTVPDIYRVSFIVVAVASAPFVLKLLFASLQHFVAVTIPWVRDSFSRWLTPPYLFFFLNCIILALIANSSGWHRKFNLAPASNPPDEPQEPDHNRESLQVKAIDIHRQDSAAPEEMNKIIQHEYNEETEVIDKGSVLTPLLEVGESSTGSSEAAEWKPVMGIAASAVDDQSNKMLASARFTRRKVSGHESGFKSLRVNQKHREETLESVWKNITEGRHPPLTRHLRSTPDGSRNDHSSQISARRRCEEESSGGRSAGSLKRESSVGIDDLNKRVEAFINNFNAEMRLQKEHSLLHYMEMINRGNSHKFPTISVDESNLGALQLTGWLNRTRIAIQDFQKITFSHVFREANSLADDLSKRGIYEQEGVINISEFRQGRLDETRRSRIY